jgi:hypothetical protein
VVLKDVENGGTMKDRVIATFVLLVIVAVMVLFLSEKDEPELASNLVVISQGSVKELESNGFYGGDSSKIADDKLVTISLLSTSLDEVFCFLSKNLGYIFVLPGFVTVERVEITTIDMGISDVMDRLLADKDLIWSGYGNVILISEKVSSPQE